MLGLCIVYLVPDDESEVLLHHSLAGLKRRTMAPHKIYGCALRLPPRLEAALQEGGVILPRLATRSFEAMTDEHAYYLDALIDHAFADGCSHVVTFDMDSWPLLPMWEDHYRSLLTPDAPVAAIVRNEVRDNFPFAAFTMLDASFWMPGRSSFSATLRGDYPVAITSQISRPAETGAGILAQLLIDGRSFFPLYRTNVWNAHPLMAGIYGGALFHLGAGSRSPGFITDGPEFGLDGSPLRGRYGAAVNEARRRCFLDFLQRDEEVFYRELSGGPPSFAPLSAQRAGSIGAGA